MRYIKLLKNNGYVIVALDNIQSVATMVMNPYSYNQSYGIEICYFGDEKISLYWKQESDRDKAFVKLESKLNMV